MDFQHTQERRALADTLGRFIGDNNTIEARHLSARSDIGFSRERWQGFAELGAIGALFDEQHGGYGGGGFDIAVVFEALGRGLVVEPFLGSLMAGVALAADGEKDRSETIGAISDGSLLVGFAHEEPGSRYAASHVATTAVRSASGWVLDGIKAMVRQGSSAELLVVSARTSGSVGDEHGVTLFLVRRETGGVTAKDFSAVDGGRIAEASLAGVAIDDAAVIGPIDEGFAIIERAVGAGLLALCAEAVGAMDVAKDATLEYLQTRKQFGVPIGSFQALQHRMATMALEIEQARSAVINAGVAFDGADRRQREAALSAAKYTVGRVGTLVAEECIQLHGGIGMTWELPMPHYAKRLTMIDHQLGDADYHLERYVALSK
ncbi:acyl-CoA dehydrogenase family protein [soil metagenome]